MSIDDAPAVDTSFDRYARMLQRVTAADITLVTLIEPDRQVFLGAQGLPVDLDETRQTPLSHSFCQHVVADGLPLITSDAREVERLSSNLAIPDLGVVAYAGWPLRDHTGEVVGSLCAVHRTEREWTAGDLEALEDIAASCSTELAQRGLIRLAAAGAAQARDLSDRSSVLLALSEGLSTTRTLPEIAAAVERVSVEALGCLRAGIWLRDAAPGVRDLPEILTFVEPSAGDWTSARLHSELPLDASNPVGATLLDGLPVEFEHVAAQNLLYPHLTNPGQVGEGRTFLPLQARGHVYGTLALVWPQVRGFSAGDRITFTALAAYTAQAVQRAQLFQERLDALVTLQSAMMSQLPEPEHLSLAARYRPAAERDQVGGDWYDAVVMPSGATALMIGDVVGHDIAAAAIMGQLRSMLRALAWALDDAPSYNVARLDQAMDELGVEGIASLVYARIDPSDPGDPGDSSDPSDPGAAEPGAGARTLRWTNAGHPPPLLVEPDGSTRWLENTSTDVMVGISPDGFRGDNRATIADGSTLLLYTDGLVERRDEDITDGLDRLAASAARHHALEVSPFLDAVLADLLGPRLNDDVALLAVRFDPQPPR